MREPRNIRIFGRDAVVINWLVLVTLAGVVSTGALMLKEFIFEELDIYGGIWNELPHFDWLNQVHLYSGIAIFGVGLLHILFNLNNKEMEILPKNPAREIKGILHTFMYILFLAKRDEMGSHGKYKGNQRLSYIMLVYILGTIGLSTILMQIEPVHEAGFLIHLALGVHLILVVLYRAVFHLRKRDMVQFRAYYMTGELPEWYVRKNHYLWFLQLIGRKMPDEDVPDIGSDDEPETKAEVEGEEAPEAIKEVAAEEISAEAPKKEPAEPTPPPATPPAESPQPTEPAEPKPAPEGSISDEVSKEVSA